MMTIKNTKHFWTNIQKCLILFVLLLFFISCTKKKDSLTAAAFKTNSGWGYTIAFKENIFIKQTIIPAISENKSFATESDAKKVGELVKAKLKHRLSPGVTKKDLILLKIKL